MRARIALAALLLGACYHGPEDIPSRKIAPAATRQAQAPAPDSAAGPCSDSLYLALKRIPVDSLSPRQWELFRVRDAACVQSRPSQPTP